ncbi:MAG TPA: nitrogen regulation protein NR(II) [Pararhizobium sp.]|nr:nitrogen regulation protein NR(II) [Pararhizobium sp.]
MTLPGRLPDATTDGMATAILHAIQQPVIVVDEGGCATFVNWQAESFFGSSAAHLARHPLHEFVPFGSPLLTLIEQVRSRRAPINGYRVDLSSPRLGPDKLVDVYAAPLAGEEGPIVVVLHERSMTEKIDRQLTHRAAARSVTGLASMLAHEIKNPLSGIRGAAQLLESSVEGEDRTLTRLIRDETDRIVSLVDRMEVFSDERPIDRQPVNIHSVLDQVKALAQAGFGRGIRITENYDPSLPPVFGNRDQLVQVFLNLVKNAAEAVECQHEPEIRLCTAYRSGVSLAVAGTREKLSLPLEFCVQDNGPGVAADLLPHLFDPFVTTKTNGSGLGLALVAKIIGGHGGIIECDSQPGRTTLRVLMPASKDALPVDTLPGDRAGEMA